MPRPAALIVCVALALAACKGPAEPAAPADPIAAARDQVTARLEMPETARFGEVFTSTLSGSPVVCGFVSWGDAESGNSGEQPFYVKDGEAVILSPESFAAFREAWSRQCQAL